jgi:hypothetical protein
VGKESTKFAGKSTSNRSNYSFSSKDDTWLSYEDVERVAMDAFIKKQKSKSRSLSRKKRKGSVDQYSLARYSKSTGKATVADIYNEWVNGVDGKPPIEDLDQRFPNQSWLKIANGRPGLPDYHRRRAIVLEIKRLQEEEKLSLEKALKKLEDIRGKEEWSIKELAKSFLKDEREKEK